jgi:mannose-6-phosphate isomerase-like protein (cupin superfamily)
VTRQVVTGVSDDGRSVVTADLEIDNTSTPATSDSTADLWGADEIVTLPSDGERPSYSEFLPSSGGFRCKLAIFAAPPEAVQHERATSEQLTKSGLSPDFEPGRLHTTDSIDIGYVIEGAIDLTLDDGVIVHLGAGDVIVQNGTTHGWRNPGPGECRVLFTIIGASRP